VLEISKEIGEDCMEAGTGRTAIGLMIFDATKMGCQMLAHVLTDFSAELKIVGQSTSSIIDAGSLVHQADVALVSADLSEGPGSGFMLVREIRKTANPARCIALLDDCHRDQVVESFSAGAMGVCGRNESCEILCKCIDRVYHGQIWANSEQLHYVLETLWAGNRIRLTDARGNALLTRREEDIVFLVAEGLRNRQIGEQLKLSEHTIRNHLFHIFEKLGISSRSELILYSIEQGKRTNSAAAG
jgi:DNA-binding NarL/FixJ family response regulator